MNKLKNIQSNHKTLKRMKLGEQQKWYLKFRENFDVREYEADKREQLIEMILYKSSKCCCHFNGNPFEQK